MHFEKVLFANTNRASSFSKNHLYFLFIMGEAVSPLTGTIKYSSCNLDLKINKGSKLSHCHSESLCIRANVKFVRVVECFIRYLTFII